MAPRLATQQAKDLSSKSTTSRDAYKLPDSPLLVDVKRRLAQPDTVTLRSRRADTMSCDQNLHWTSHPSLG
jgi:hypothetical protein